jgi:hypothetical protein
MVYGKAKKFSVKQKAMPAGAGSLAPPFYVPLWVKVKPERVIYIEVSCNFCNKMTSKDTF